MKKTINKLPVEQEGGLELMELKEEVEILHKQIDSLCTTSLDIQKKNVELNEKLRELQQTNKNLKSIQKKKDEFFSMVVHDIKNPTTIIKNLVELLKDIDASDEERNLIIEDLVASTRQIVALSQEISQVLVLESSDIKLFYEYADPAILVEEVVRRNSINAKNKEQAMVVKIEPDLPQFRVDVTKIMEVLDNLVSNAIKYTQLKGQITVSCHQKNELILIEIADTGLGMSPEDIQRAFKFGKKLSAKPTAGEHSTGIGLWIVKRILEAHKGRIAITSKLGIGTTFSVEIPIVPTSDQNKRKK